ncbi:hypothetical protein CULT_400003 [[Clostridium] ultunense Esp]|nr:hypothetical protein CULT_400003 [[Clostridium] ultunense Esp]
MEVEVSWEWRESVGGTTESEDCKGEGGEGEGEDPSSDGTTEEGFPLPHPAIQRKMVNRRKKNSPKNLFMFDPLREKISYFYIIEPLGDWK